MLAKLRAIGRQTERVREGSGRLTAVIISRAPPSDSDGDMPPRAWNVIHVKRSDENVFEALACDSFSLKVGVANE